MHEHYKNGLSTKEIGAMYGMGCCNVQTLFRSRSLPVRTLPRRTINNRYFESIDAPKKAYICGFLAADGSVSKNSFGIKLSARDASVLEMIKGELESDVPIKYRDGKRIGDTRYTQADFCYIRFSNTKMVNDLIAIGITPRKSLTLEPPKNIPEEFIKYFILGYFDGDGTINHNNPKNPRFSVLGTKNMVDFVREHLIKNAGLTDGNLYERGDGEVKFYHMNWGGALNAIKFRDYMYDEISSQFSLVRKRDKFLSVKTVERVYKKGRTVLQYDLSWNLLRRWTSGVRGAASEMGVCKRNLYEAVSSRKLTAYGCKWKYEDVE